MKFEVVNRFGKTMMQCADYQYIPAKDILESMYRAAYRFKLDGKDISLKKAKELINGNTLKQAGEQCEKMSK